MGAELFRLSVGNGALNVPDEPENYQPYAPRRKIFV